MILLAIETTGSTCGVSVVKSEPHAPFQLMALQEIYQENVHDAQLALLVQQALLSAQLTIEAVDVVAVSGGPGSFTGTRIGMSLAKGLCYTQQPKLMVIDTMHALAEASVEVATAAQQSTMTVVIASHRDLVYVAQYAVQGAGTLLYRTEHDIQLVPISEVTGRSDLGLVCGPGAGKIIASPISGLTRLSSRFVALRAVREITAGVAEFADPHTATPLYRQEFVGRA